MSRTDFKLRIEAYAKAVQGGIMSPNEARRRENLAPKEGGEDIYLQRQMTPLSKIEQALDNEIGTPGPEQEPEPDVKTIKAGILQYVH